jgi:cell division protein FtsB
MQFVPRSLVFLAAILLLGGYSYFTLRERIPALLEKREQIRREQEANIDIARENDYKRERIKKLLESKSQQDLEIRKKLKMLQKNETEFILPGAPKTPAQ